MSMSNIVTTHQPQWLIYIFFFKEKNERFNLAGIWGDYEQHVKKTDSG